MEISLIFYMTSVGVRGRWAAFSSVSLTSALITLLIIVEECSWLIDEFSSNLNLFGVGSDELSLRSAFGDEEGGGALVIGGITNWETGFKLEKPRRIIDDVMQRQILTSGCFAVELAIH